MITQLKKAISRSVGNPGYLWYFWRNVDIIHDHFPLLHHFLERRKALDLGGPSVLAKLHVILRTTDSVMNINATRRLEDAGIVSRNDVLRVGGCSLFPAAARFAEKYGRDNIRVTLVTDRLSDAGQRQYRMAAESCGMDFEIVAAKGSGNGPTFQTQIDVALADADDTLEFILEDDYMLDVEALATCFEVMHGHSNVIGMTPHFHPDRVRRQDIGKLAAIGGRLYCRVFSTCCTFFMSRRDIGRYEKKLRLYDGWEKGSVGCAWERELCLSPLGWTMAEHLHRCDLSPVCTWPSASKAHEDAFGRIRR